MHACGYALMQWLLLNLVPGKSCWLFLLHVVIQDKVVEGSLNNAAPLLNALCNVNYA